MYNLIGRGDSKEAHCVLDGITNERMADRVKLWGTVTHFRRKNIKAVKSGKVNETWSSMSL